MEIVNTEDIPFNVAGLRLTNHEANPSVSFPPFTVNGGDHRVLWCDNDPEDGPLHTSLMSKPLGTI